MMLDKKQIWAIFLFEFKMGCKAAETTHNITNAFDPGTANERTVQGWLKEETRALRMSSTVAGHQKVTTTTQSHHSKLMLLQIHKKLPKNSALIILWSLGIWSKLERWESLVSGCPMSWLKIKKIIILKCLLLLFYIRTTNHFSIGLWRRTKSGFFMTTGDNQLSGWTKKKLQSTSQRQTCTKKKSRSLFGGLLHVWSTTAFWMLVNPLHLRTVLTNWWGTPKHHNAYSQHWSTERAQFFFMTTPNHTKLQKLNELGYDILPYLPYSPDLLPTNYHFFKLFDNFLQGKRFHNQMEAENAFQEFVKSWSTDFYAIGINKLTSH